MDKKWTEEAWEDYLGMQLDKRRLKKVNELLKDIDLNGYSGLGKPGPLKADMSGYWSRRIDDYNRIVYCIREGDGQKFVEIVQCGSHYHK